MAREFRLLSVLWLVVACHVAATASTPAPTPQTEPTTASTPGPTTQTEPTTASTPAPTTQTEPATASTPGPTTQTEPTTASTPGPTTQTEPTTASTPGPTTQTEPTTASTPAPTTQTEPTTASTPAPTTQTEPTTASTPAPTTQTEPTTASTPGPTTQTEPTTASTQAQTPQTEPTTASTPGPTTQTEPTTASTPGPTTQTEPTTASTQAQTEPTTASTQAQTEPTTASTQAQTEPTTASTPAPTPQTEPTTASTPAPTTQTEPTTASTQAQTEPTTASTPAPTTHSGATAPSTPAPTTHSGATAPSTEPPTTSSEADNTTTPEPTTTPLPVPDPCRGNPCRDGSTCEPRLNQNFTCLCLAGEYNYERKICESAKVFPGNLDMPKLTFHKDMTDKTSAKFHEASEDITKEMESVFEKSSYSGSIVLELSKLSNTDSRYWSRSEDGVSATVEMFFNPDAGITSAQVQQTIKEASDCPACLLGSATFSNTSLCDKAPCDLTTTTCASLDGSYTCNCVDNYIKTNFSDRICVACPSGEQAVRSEKCEPCPFGRSGFNCSEQWKLLLTIIGSVLGGLLLITLILLPVLACRPSKKSSKKNKKSDAEKSFNSQPHAKAPLVNSSLANSYAASVNRPANGMSGFANIGVPRIPRATSTNSWDSRTNLEMTPSNSRQNLIPGRNPRLYDDHEDMNPYARARPQNNPYGQNRPQVNPYAQSQGHSNPYYMHDNDRRFN